MDNIPSAYAEEAVAWAVENGLLQGSEAGDLMLRQPVTRQQLAAVLYRFAKLEGQTCYIIKVEFPECGGVSGLFRERRRMIPQISQTLEPG